MTSRPPQLKKRPRSFVSNGLIAALIIETFVYVCFATRHLVTTQLLGEIILNC